MGHHELAIRNWLQSSSVPRIPSIGSRSLITRRPIRLRSVSEVPPPSVP
jgi:hypothetical protein